MKHILVAGLMVMLLVLLVIFIFNMNERRVMPENTIAITDRMVVIDGPVFVGKRWRSYILKDTLTEKQYLVIGNYDCISVTHLEVTVEK